VILIYYETRYIAISGISVLRGNKLKTNKTATFVILSAFILSTLLLNTAYGVTGNFEPDSTPYAGGVVLFSDAGKQQPMGYCSGFLISPTVMLTTGHSFVGVGAVSVCFDKGPIIYSIGENGKIVYSTNEGAAAIYNGKLTAYPEYLVSLMTSTNKANQVFSSSDIGVINLDKRVSGVTVFPTLPEAGFSDSLPVKTALRVIGYGVQYQVTPKKNGVENSWVGTLSCNSAKVNLLSGNLVGSAKYLRCIASPSQDKGGIAFGDSGGPVLYKVGGQDIVLAVNAYVSNVNCAGVTYHTRIDIPQVLGWINEFLE